MNNAHYTGKPCIKCCATCEACGTSKDLQLDHKVPPKLGGSNVPANLRPLCEPHNRSEYQRIRILTRPHLSYHQQYIMDDLKRGCRIDRLMQHATRRTTYMVVGGNMNKNEQIVNYGIAPATFNVLQRNGLVQERGASGRFYLASA